MVTIAPIQLILNSRFLWEIRDLSPWVLLALLGIPGLILILNLLPLPAVKGLEVLHIGRTAINSVISSIKSQILNRRDTKLESAWKPGEPEAIRGGATGLAEVGEVLFPGQAPFAEALSRTYSEVDGDEALYSYCGRQELEDFLRDTFRETTELQTWLEHEGPDSESAVVDAEIKDPDFPESEVDFREARVFEPDETIHVPAPVDTEVDEDVGQIVSELEFLSLAGVPEPNPYEVGGLSMDKPEAPAKQIGPGVSIFDALLSKCDEEAKLIILPEIMAVGGQRELALLEFLASHGSRPVAKLAGKLGRKMRARLRAENTIAPAKSGTSHIGHDQIPEEGKRALEFYFLDEEVQ